MFVFLETGNLLHLYKTYLMENFGDFDPEEADRLYEEKQKKIRSHPLRIKAHEIVKTVFSMAAAMDETEKDRVGNLLVQSAMIIEAKISGAVGSESWLICMQNAAIIRQHGHDLLIARHSLETFTATDKKYIDLLRKDVEEFQQLFREWVGSFSKMEKEEYDDEWGLFIRN